MKAKKKKTLAKIEGFKMHYRQLCEIEFATRISTAFVRFKMS